MPTERRVVNDATRKDINDVMERNNDQVFGLKFWSWTEIESEKLKEVCNFDVDLIFKNEQRSKVRWLIEAYKKEKVWSMEVDKRLVNQLFDLAILNCTWV
jgi:hypothetical protein